MSNVVIRAPAALLFVILTACDTISGVTRHSNDIGSIPVDAYQCVADVIGNMEDVVLVRYTVEKGSRPLTLTGIQDPDVVHSYWYRYNGIGSGIQLIKKYHGGVEYYQSHIYINRIPPQADIDVIRPVMVRIENAIADQCGITILTTRVTERCSNVRCE